MVHCAIGVNASVCCYSLERYSTTGFLDGCDFVRVEIGRERLSNGVRVGRNLSHALPRDGAGEEQQKFQLSVSIRVEQSC